MKISLFFKVVIMLISLAAVLHAIRALQSGEVAEKASDPQSAVGALIGSDYSPMNWCPDGTVKIELYSQKGEPQKILTNPSEISSLCEIMMGAFANEGNRELTFRKRMIATSSSGEERSLEQADNNQPLFHVKGLPFSSPMLVKALERLEAP